MKDSTDPADDPRPQPPDKPLPAECCESGCPVCVYDIYASELEGIAKPWPHGWNVIRRRAIHRPDPG